MQRKISFAGLFLVSIFFVQNVNANDTASIDRLLQFPDRFFSSLDAETKKLEALVIQQSKHYLHRLEKKEKKLRRKLQYFDSSKNQLLNSYDEFEKLRLKLNDGSVNAMSAPIGEYLPGVDSIQGILNFIKSNSKEFNVNIRKKAAESLKQFQSLQARLQEAENIKLFIRQRREQIQQLIESSASLPKNIIRHFNKYKQDIFQYTEQIRSYKDMLNDPSRLQENALILLNKLPAFKQFMEKHSLIAGLFSLPSSYVSSSLDGFQTRAQVEQMIGQRFPASSQDPSQLVTQQLDGFKKNFDVIKDKINLLGGKAENLELPNYKGNPHRLKRFWKRFEFGTNYQTVQKTYYFPVTTDIGLSMGYRISDKWLVGTGLSYKLGLGTSWKDIRFSSEGVGLRSFIDMQLKGKIHLSGGYEMNYHSAFSRIEQLKAFNNWFHSSLLGLTKKYQINAKRKGEFRILYDFFHNRHIPATQPILFRLGYGL